MCVWCFAFANPVQAQYKKALKYFARAEYEDAIPIFRECLSKPKFATRANYRLAECYRKSNRMGQSEIFYKAALDGNTYEDDARFYYAQALKINGKYKDAEREFNLYSKAGRDANLIRLAKEELKFIKNVDSLQSLRNYYEIQNLESVNTAVAEFSPAFFEGKMIFSTARKEGVFKTTGGGFLGIYSFQFTDFERLKGFVELYDEAVNEPMIHEASATFSPDGRLMLFARGNKDEKGAAPDVDIYKRELYSDGWHAPEISSLSSPESWEACPFISPDGKKIYFASNREGSFGGTDIYEATISKNGDIAGVRNMGPRINTPGNEMFPYITDDGRLIFASDGHPGFGGLDLFIATTGKDRKINIRNMGIPFNSSADDFALAYYTDSTGFFSSSRAGGKGDDDIYYFLDKTPKTKIVNYFVQIQAYQLNEADSTEIPISNAQITFATDKQQVLNTGVSDEEGKIAPIPVKLHKDYEITAAKAPEYFKRTEPFTMRGKAIPEELLVEAVTDTILLVKVQLDPIVIGKEIILQNIYYDRYESYIRTDAARELDKLVKLLNDNPEIYIELSSHTDSRGTDTYNMDLSQARAEAAVNYLIEQGINPRRLRAQGYGETKLILPSAVTEEEHQTNRRTEFKVIRIAN